MLKNKYSLLLLFLSFSTYLFSVNNVFASPSITSHLLNGSAQNVTFNPNNTGTISIEVKANTPVKFTRLYICSLSQVCNGTSGNYTRYFTQSDVSDTITKIWNGKKTGDVEIVPAGEYKIMVSMTEGTNSPVTEFGQYSIFVDFSNANNNSTSSNSNENNISTTINSVNNSSSVSTYVSTHSETEDISDYDEKTDFEVTAGRERITTIGSPIEFDAKYTLSQNNQCLPTFKWSFGDGFEAEGKKVTHTYKHIGEYQVVLKSSCADHISISRAITKVISPNISLLNMANGDINIINNGKNEMNIGNWKIKGGQKDFVFPQDTIISSGKTIILSKEDTKFDDSTDKISLNNPSNGEVSFVYIKNMSISQATSTDSSYISVYEADELVKEYKEKIALNEKPIGKIEKIKEAEVKINIGDNISDNNLSQTASVLESINLPPTRNFWSKLVNIPINIVKSFINVFYDF